MERHELRAALAVIIVSQDGRSEADALAWADAEIAARGAGVWQQLGEVLVHCSDPAAPFAEQTLWAFYTPARLSLPSRLPAEA